MIQNDTDDEAAAIFCNAPDRETARRIADRLVAERLAACVNILAPCESVFRWDGKTERGEEFPMIVKTARARVDAVAAAVRDAHPFEVPEVVALPIIGGLPEYLAWVRDETTESDPAPESQRT